MVTQGVTAAREVQRSFDFTLKAIGALPNKRDPKVSNMCPTEVRIVWTKPEAVLLWPLAGFVDAVVASANPWPHL